MKPVIWMHLVTVDGEQRIRAWTADPKRAVAFAAEGIVMTPLYAHPVAPAPGAGTVREALADRFEACTYLHSARDQHGQTHVGPSFTKDEIDVVVAALRGAATPSAPQSTPRPENCATADPVCHFPSCVCADVKGNIIDPADGAS